MSSATQAPTDADSIIHGPVLAFAVVMSISKVE